MQDPADHVWHFDPVVSSETEHWVEYIGIGYMTAGIIHTRFVFE